MYLLLGGNSGYAVIVCEFSNHRFTDIQRIYSPMSLMSVNKLSGCLSFRDIAKFGIYLNLNFR